MLLEIRNLAKSFGGVQAVKDFSLQADKNQIVSIIGPNGAGKTTVFNLVSGIYKADAGQILFDGQDISSLPQFAIARRGISRTFQNIRLFRGLTVLENVMTALDATTHYSIFHAMLTRPGSRRQERANRDRAMKVLETVGLLALRDEHPENLPYGLQRRVELARAIVSDPRLLMLDEPAAGLNPSEVSDFIQLIQKVRDMYGFGIVIIEHRMKVVNELSEHIYVINFGNLLTHGAPEAVRNNPDVIKAYIGEEDR